MATDEERIPQSMTKLKADLEVGLLEAQPSSNGPRMGSKLAVVVALGVLVWSSVFQSEASQALQEHAHFVKPFFIVCFNHTMTGLLLPMVIVYFKVFGSSRDRYETSWRDVSSILRRHSVLPIEELFRIATFLSVFYMVADYFWYAALTGVSVTAATAISNCSPLFVYCFSICFLRERLLTGKVLGVFIAFAGVTLILLYQNQGNQLSLALLQDGSIVAGVFVVVSSALTAGYGVAFKAILGDELTDTSTVLILSGFIGVLTIPMWILGTITLAYCPFASIHEAAGWPSTNEGLELLFTSGALAVLYNVCMPLLLCWTSPLETSVGGMLAIPLSGALDTVFHHTRFSIECIFGSVLVMLGFSVLEYGSRLNKSSLGAVKGDSYQPEEEESSFLMKR